MQEMQVQSLGQEDPLKEKMVTHSSILAWESHGQRSLLGAAGHDVAKSHSLNSTHPLYLPVVDWTTDNTNESKCN